MHIKFITLRTTAPHSGLADTNDRCPLPSPLGTQRRQSSGPGGAGRDARATGPISQVAAQPQDVLGSILFILKLLPLTEQIAFDLRLLSV